MPYVDAHSKICRPTEVQEIKEGDLVLVSPTTLNVDRTLIVFPPLSLVSEQCEHEIMSLSWVEGITVNKRITESVISVKGEEYVKEGEIQILEPSILTAFTFKQLIGNKIKGYVSRVKGIPLISVNNIPVISLDKGIVYTGIQFLNNENNRDNILRLFTYSIFYYILSKSSEG
ncbi:hypothetical protein V6M85_00665 [Sulfolobus tengchongensis]|uniref:Uncharacterized protein n=1 Tax=Sulfolobus tengchongensis TaxID=207809 RepID=A0AAX4L0I8_9CREN